MKLIIRKYPDPILREKAKKIKDSLSSNIQGLISGMRETMRANQGKGLSAPQVGVRVRLFVVEIEGEDMLDGVFINPKITAKSRKKIIAEEGCLSFPGQFLPVSRCSQVQMRYLDQHGQPRKIKAQGILARAFQHELDHLDGILLIDRAKKRPPGKIKKKKI